MTTFRFNKLIVAASFITFLSLLLVGNNGYAKEDKIESEDVVLEEVELEQQPEVVEEVIEEIKTPTFSDVKEDSFAYEAIEYLVGLGLVSGSGDGKFHPEAKIKRSELAKIIAVDKGYQASANYVVKATDLQKGHWAYNYIAALEKETILQGSNGLIRPNDNVTRAEVAVLLNRVYNLSPPSYFHYFTDVSYSHWAYHSINSLATNGITSQAGKAFKPDEAISRGEFALFFARTLDDRFKPYKK